MRYSAWTGFVLTRLVRSCLVWSGLDWTGLDWTGLDWTGLDWTGLDWTGLVWSESGLVAPGLVWLSLVWLPHFYENVQLLSVIIGLMTLLNHVFPLFFSRYFYGGSGAFTLVEATTDTLNLTMIDEYDKKMHTASLTPRTSIDPADRQTIPSNHSVLDDFFSLQTSYNKSPVDPAMVDDYDF